MAVRKKPAAESSPQHVVLEVKVNQEPSYREVNKRTDEWQDKLQRDWGLAKTKKAFAASELRSGFGFDLSQGAEIGTITETPSDVKEALEQVRIWYRKSFFIQEILKLKYSLFNYGFQLKPVEDDGDSKAFDKWQKLYRSRIKRFVRETWMDKLAMNNAVAFWRRPKGNRPSSRDARIITLPPERCRYTDAMGIEKLAVKLGWHEEDFKVSPNATDKTNFFLPPDDIKRYAQGNMLQLLERHGEFFRVYKEERVGWGFAWPSMQSLFHTFAQDESLEIADRLWAFVARLTERRHKIGHEIKQGPRAGLPIHFVTKERSKATLEFYGGRSGFVDSVTNFDQSIEFPFPSTDRFDKEKYESVWGRMALWAGPVGHYLYGLHTGKGSMPLLMEAIQPEAEEARDALSDHIIDVITQVFEPPMEIEACWSNRIFQDKRQSMEMIKFLLGCGALSQETALELAGFQVKLERERKQKEANLAKNETTKGQVFPVYDPAHGDPNQAGSSGGRPAGQKDGGSRAQLNGEVE